MNSTVLRFDGGAIPAGGGTSSDRAIHHLFLRELTITELGQEVSVYALLDLDKPTLVAPNYEPVSAFTLFDWCSRGDVLQVDVAEALETGTNTYSAFFESANASTSNDGSYIEECVIRVDTKLSGTTPKINTRYLHLSQILDESTSIAYMCQHTTLNDHVTYGDELRRTGKVHFLKAVYDSQAGERAPYGYWIVDLEKPNPQSSYGYDYAMADEIIAKLSAGEIFVLSTYPTAPSPEEDLYIMCSSALQSRQGHEAVRIWFTRMFASNSPEYMYFTTIYTPSMYNSEWSENNYPEGRMAILNWRGQQDARSEFRFMEYTELATVATTGSYEDLSDKPDIPELVQSDWAEADSSSPAYILNKPDLSLKEDVSNKALTVLDPTSETEYPSSKTVAGFVNANINLISKRAVYWNDASCYAGGSANRYFKLATITSEALQNNINNVWRTIVSTDSVTEVAYLRLNVRLNASGDQPVGNLNVSPIGIWNYAVSFTLVLRGTVGNVVVELWAHHEGGYRSTVISDMGGGSFSITLPNKKDWTYTSYNNNGSSSIPTDAGTQVINAVVDP